MRSKGLNSLAKKKADEVMQQALAVASEVLAAIKPLLSADECRRLVAHLDGFTRTQDYTAFEPIRALAERAGVIEKFDKMVELTKTVVSLGGTTL